jgi:hypothetical protein
MMSVIDTKILKPLSVQFIETEHFVILKRGCTELRIDGKGAAETIGRIFLYATGNNMTCQNICEQFPLPLREAVRSMIAQLVSKKILVAEDGNCLQKDDLETSLDIFYWHFGETAESAKRKLNEVFIDIIGVNAITKQLVTSFLEGGFTNFQVIDFPLLRNLRLFDNEGRLISAQWPVPSIPLSYNQWEKRLGEKPPHCLVASSDFGSQTLLGQWNRFCIERNYHFFPIALKNLVGFLGPMVIPGETACYACLLARVRTGNRSIRFSIPTFYWGTSFNVFYTWRNCRI